MNISNIKVYLDPGHGTYDPGATNKKVDPKLYEWKINEIVVNHAKEALLLYGAEVKVRDNTDTKFWGLANLFKIAEESDNWGANVFVSVHTNAGGGAGGTETYTKSNYSSFSNNLANHVQNQLVNTFNRPDRGIKRKDYNVLKYNDAWCILTELLFIDVEEDISLLQDSTKLQQAGKAIARGIKEFVEELPEV